MMTMKRYFMTAALLLLTLTAAPAQEADTTAAASAAERVAVPTESTGTRWDRANTAYINGNFAEAEESYRSLLDEGLSSARLYYNLGNACFKQEKLGCAILYYRRALKLSPSNGDIKHNLEVAETLTKDNIEDIPEFFLATWMRGIRNMMGCTAWSLLSLAFLATALALVLFYLLSNRLALRKWGFYGTLAALLLFILSSAMAMAERREMLDESKAVVMSSSAAVKSSPDRSSTDLFVLHEGTVVEITDSLEEWAEVMIADGKKGWIERKKIEVI